MKTILFTGCTDGIGLEAAKILLGNGHRVLMHGRNPSKLQSVSRNLGVAETDTFLADLADLSQVYSMAKNVLTKHDRLDVIVNNAGVFKSPHASVCSRQGVDLRLAVNTIAPYVLTKELLPIISKHGRIINVSSAGQAPVDLDRAFPTQNQSAKDEAKPSPYSNNDFEAYCQSKLAMIQWTNALAQEQQQHEIIIASLNPASLIGTKMVKEGFGVAEGKSLQIGTDILVEAAVGDSFDEKANGKYFDNDRGEFSQPHPDALNADKNRLLLERMDQWLLTQHNLN